jgi:hypothetical protein
MPNAVNTNPEATDPAAKRCEFHNRQSLRSDKSGFLQALAERAQAIRVKVRHAKRSDHVPPVDCAPAVSGQLMAILPGENSPRLVGLSSGPRASAYHIDRSYAAAQQIARLTSALGLRCQNALS